MLPRATVAAAQALQMQVTQGEVVTSREFRGDVKALPHVPLAPAEPREGSEDDERNGVRQPPIDFNKQPLPGATEPVEALPSGLTSLAPVSSLPSPSQNFAGLNVYSGCTGGLCGAGYPPDTNGDVGPNNYMQAVNTSIGIFTKAGIPQAAFTFNSFWAGAGTGTPCDTSNSGDPVVLYDPLADRFIFMDLAWNNLTTGPYYFCFAVSQTSNPLGNYWYYAIRADDGTHPWLPDYPKAAIWPDGIYVSANMFCEQATGCSGGTDSFQEVRLWALNRTQMEAGQSLQSVITDTGSTSYFSLLPSNLRGTQPPAGTPNYFIAEDQFAYAFDVFKFHAVYGGAGSTFTGPTQVSQGSYTTPNGAVVPQPSTATKLDSLYDRLMMQNQYRNIGGTESLWTAHTIRASSASNTGIQWAQLNVTGGTVATTPVQQQRYFPDTTLYRWLPSLAVDRQGNMAVGYSGSSSGTFPAILYSGRLSTDPVNTLESEITLQSGGGSQSTSCGGSACTRWGDYSAMTVDPSDDCTFWYTTEYYTATGGTWNTRIGSFTFSTCPAATPTATNGPTSTPTPIPTNTVAATPTNTPLPPSTATSTPIPTATQSPTSPPVTGTATASFTFTSTAAPTNTPTETPTPSVSATAPATASPTLTATATLVPTPTPNPTPTPTPIPSPTPTPTTTATVTATPEHHDAVVLPIKPVKVIVPVGKAVTKRLRVKVRNADAPEPTPDHIKLMVSSNCPGGVSIGTPDFIPSTPLVADDTVAVASGKMASAVVPVTVHPLDFANRNHLAPSRCTLTFVASTDVPGNADPTVSNNTMTVELNVVDKNVQEVATSHESLIDSMPPLTVTIRKGTATLFKRAKPKVTNADIIPTPQLTTDAIQVTVDLSGCAGITLAALDMASRVPGAQDTVSVKGGAAAIGSLQLKINAAAIATASKLSPARCTAVVSAAIGGNTEPDSSNNTTQLMIDVVDSNDL